MGGKWMKKIEKFNAYVLRASMEYQYLTDHAKPSLVKKTQMVLCYMLKQMILTQIIHQKDLIVKLVSGIAMTLRNEESNHL